MGTDPVSPDRCYWVRIEDGSAHLIPMCWATVTSWPEACTCGVAGSHLEKAAADVMRLQARLAWAMNRLEVRRFEADQMRSDIRHWIGVLRAHGIDPSAHNPPEEKL